LPYLIGERSPHWNPLASGVFVGLTMSHGRAETGRAVLEGVAFNLKMILDTFLEQFFTKTTSPFLWYIWARTAIDWKAAPEIGISTPR